ncbi:MAG: diacylglycerol kinase family protein [Adlercreutzia sp.]|uniref:diacylglycerol kinase family protein n=1 Tax=uncultured Adlercreutzia sp. TaxID=875803 RepID=UPI00216FE447|nr:diacylglycerol kinase family protein [uncultured Adlercreutzia sp.]MCI8424919.1 diacylglycerol kinase family protein [Adlercreutzia sp.]
MARQAEENVEGEGREGGARAGARDDGRLARTAADSRRCGDGAFPLACAFRCAGRGVAYAFTSQRNLKIQLALAVAAVAAGFAFGIGRAEWLAIVLCIMVVSVAEVVNTAIESVVDLASPEWHELARAAKDAGAGAVLLASAGSVVVALIVFVPRIAALF